MKHLVARQFIDDVRVQLLPCLQSVYLAQNSTETALLKVQTLYWLLLIAAICRC